MSFTSAILLAVFSLVVILLTSPTLYWHFKHRNVGASFATAWILVMNLIVFTNAVIWPDDKALERYQGEILCDIQVKIQIASQVAFPASFSCVLRALAQVMDIDRAALGRTQTEQRRQLAIDLLCCVFFPIVQMFFHYVVQARRYAIFGVSGCVPSANNSWLTVLLIYVPPVLWDLLCTYFAVLTLIRLHRYKSSLGNILTACSTNRSRFLRLLALCLLWIIASIPIQAFTFYVNLSFPRDSYSWDDSHDPELLAEIDAVPTNGVVAFDRYIWLGTGFAIFLFFGTGKDAKDMYASWLKASHIHLMLPKTLREKLWNRRVFSATGLTNSTTQRPLFNRGTRMPSSMHTSLANSIVEEHDLEELGSPKTDRSKLSFVYLHDV